MVAMSDRLTELCLKHHVLIKADNPFQRRARLLQSLWREGLGYEMGMHGSVPLGSRLAMPFAETTLSNYLTETIREVVRQEVIERPAGRGQLYARPRIFNDLLSSQPLCFNLFGELSRDLALASRVFSNLTGGRVSRVMSIWFEHSPGRGDLRYTGDHSAFDVYVEFLTPVGGRGFIGIEVKYHESMADKPSTHKARYDEVAEQMGVFPREHRPLLREAPLQQIWRDHLLAGSLKRCDGFDDGFFAFVYPRENDRCSGAIIAYRSCLVNDESMVVWTLEEIIGCIKKLTAEAWPDEVIRRYLAFDELERLKSRGEVHPRR